MSHIKAFWQRFLSFLVRPDPYEDEYTSEMIAIGRKADKSTYIMYARKDYK